MTKTHESLFADLRDAIHDLYGCGDISHSGDAGRAREEALRLVEGLEAAALSVRGMILYSVSVERDRQDAKWGGVPGEDRIDGHTYAAVLGEEFGECCKAWLERDLDALRVELIQTAAVAVAWVEELNNGGGVPRV